MYTVYTDGSCLGNPGPAGWACVIQNDNDQQIVYTGGERKSTNNRMELAAIIKSLEFLVEVADCNGEMVVYTDSEYCKNGILKWLSGWKRKGWRTANGGEVKNVDLWIEIDKLLAKCEGYVTFKWVKGHGNNKGNNQADALARAAAREYS